MKLNKCNILIIGLAKSGFASLDLLYNKYSKIFLFDSDIQACKRASNKFCALSNVFILTKLTKEVVDDVKLIVVSPGVPIDNEYITYARSIGLKVISELELGYLSCKNDFLAITGTNGKTTTTQLLGDILKTASFRVSVVGNIGVPVCSIVNKATRHDTFVCEVSSFQLAGCISFRPKIAAILNIGADHLDWHKTEENYIEAKYKIAGKLKKNDFLILNKNCDVSLKLASRVKCKVYYFDTLNPCKGAFIKEGFITIKDGKKTTNIIEVSKIKLMGNHNLENVLCAALMAYLYKVKPQYIAEAIENFLPLPHRLQPVGVVDDIEFVNDSKSTNIASCLTALKAITKPVHLILGGSDKGYEYDEIFQNLTNDIKGIVAYGQTAEKILRAAERNDYVIASVKTLKEAVFHCFKKAEAGQCVLLSPASASFDQFENYEQRGTKFEEYIKELKGLRKN